MESYQGSVCGTWMIPVHTSDVLGQRRKQSGSPDPEEPLFISSLSVGLGACVPSLPVRG